MFLLFLLKYLQCRRKKKVFFDDCKLKALFFFLLTPLRFPAEEWFLKKEYAIWKTKQNKKQWNLLQQNILSRQVVEFSTAVEVFWFNFISVSRLQQEP